jgi:hypothetical protein
MVTSPKPDTDIMRVTRQAPAPATGRFVPKLKAQGEDKREPQFDKRLAVVKQLKVGRFIVEIDADGNVDVEKGYDHVSDSL